MISLYFTIKYGSKNCQNSLHVWGTFGDYFDVLMTEQLTFTYASTSHFKSALNGICSSPQ